MNPRVIENQMDPARVGKLKICKCCGDIAKSNHFGALCCCSCKFVHFFLLLRKRCINNVKLFNNKAENEYLVKLSDLFLVPDRNR